MPLSRQALAGSREEALHQLGDWHVYVTCVTHPDAKPGVSARLNGREGERPAAPSFCGLPVLAPTGLLVCVEKVDPRRIIPLGLRKLSGWDLASVSPIDVRFAGNDHRVDAVLGG